MTPQQTAEFESVISKLQGDYANLQGLPAEIKKLQDENLQLKNSLESFRKDTLSRIQKGFNRQPVRRHEAVTHDCARYLAAIAYIGAEKYNKLSHLNATNRDLILNRSADVLGMELRAALTTTDIPLPTEFHSQVVELVWDYGDFRKHATTFPLGTGTVKLPKLKTSPAFGLIAQSGNVTEKSPQISFVTFTAEKSGGIVRIPSEIDADSIVSVGQFIARYGAREMAKWEDTWGFLADGSGTYDSKSGVCKTADTLTYKIQLAPGSGKPSNVSLQNMRDLRAKIDQAAYNNAGYYLNRTMEAQLVTYNTSATVTPYMASGPNGPTLDGFPIHWVGVMPVYDNVSNHFNQYQAVFGDLSYWYFGERGSLRADVSNDIYFATDEVGVRFLERFDTQLMADQSCAVLQLCAS
jgi:HK97 family phage major capsid protein